MSTAPANYTPSSARYFATYQIQLGSTEAERNTLNAENDRGETMPLDHIREVCRTCDTNAELRTESGHFRGWVYDDGGYRLA